MTPPPQPGYRQQTYIHLMHVHGWVSVVERRTSPKSKCLNICKLYRCFHCMRLAGLGWSCLCTYWSCRCFSHWTAIVSQEPIQYSGAGQLVLHSTITFKFNSDCAYWYIENHWYRSISIVWFWCVVQDQCHSIVVSQAAIQFIDMEQLLQAVGTWSVVLVSQYTLW